MEGGVSVVLRPCGVEVSASEGHHWSKVIKAASYLHPKGVGGPEHGVKRLMSSEYHGREVSQLGRVW